MAATAFVTLVLPRTRVPCEAIAQEAVMIALYHFFCLVVAECGGSEQFVRSVLNQYSAFVFFPLNEEAIKSLTGILK